ncbi:MAG: response regulator [Nitrospirales bacterium]
MSILIIDDDSNIRLFLKDRLVEMGFKVSEAASGGEALVFMDQEHPTGILLGINLSDMDGLTVLKELLEKAPHIAVIMMSALGNIDRLEQGIREGAMDYLVKPIEVEILEQKVRRLFG